MVEVEEFYVVISNFEFCVDNHVTKRLHYFDG